MLKRESSHLILEDINVEVGCCLVLLSLLPEVVSEGWHLKQVRLAIPAATGGISVQCKQWPHH